MATATLITDGFGSSSIFSPQFVIQGFGATASTNALATLITDAFGENNPAFSPWIVTEGYRSGGGPTVFGGWRSLLMFWLGGFSAENFVPPIPVIVVDTHDGFDSHKHKRKKEKEERLYGQIEQAFRKASGEKPIQEVIVLKQVVEQNIPFVQEDDEDEIRLLLQ